MKQEDNGHLSNSSMSGDWFPEDNFTEGVYIDYQYFDAEDITPRYEFGFGFSYTSRPTCSPGLRMMSLRMNIPIRRLLFDREDTLSCGILSR